MLLYHGVCLWLHLGSFQIKLSETKRPLWWWLIILHSGKREGKVWFYGSRFSFWATAPPRGGARFPAASGHHMQLCCCAVCVPQGHGIGWDKNKKFKGWALLQWNVCRDQKAFLVFVFYPSKEWQMLWILPTKTSLAFKGNLQECWISEYPALCLLISFTYGCFFLITCL